MTKREEGKRLIDYILMKTIDGKLDRKGGNKNSQELFDEKTITNYIIFRPTREKYPQRKVNQTGAAYKFCFLSSNRKPTRPTRSVNGGRLYSIRAKSRFYAAWL